MPVDLERLDGEWQLVRLTRVVEQRIFSRVPAMSERLPAIAAFDDNVEANRAAA